MTCAAAMSVFSDFTVLPRLLRRRYLTLKTSAVVGIAVAGLTLPLSGTLRAPAAITLSLAIVSAGASLLRTSLNTMMVNAVATEEAGTTSGVIDAIESLSRVLAPLLGGVLMEQSGPWAPGASGAVLCALALVEMLTVDP